MRFSLPTLFCLNIVFVLFPVISPDRDPTGVNSWFFDEITLYGKLLSSVVTPLLVAGTIHVSLSATHRRSIPAELLFPSLLICLLMTLSTTFAETVRIETLFMALFFPLFNVYLVLAQHQPQGAEAVLRIFKAYFTVWLLAPIVAMAIEPALWDMFFTVTVIDFSYHGLTNSRVGYGLWIGVFILLLGKPASVFQKFLLVASVATLLLSQSRGALFGLLFSYLYGFVKGRDKGKSVLPRLVLLAAVCLMPLFVWSVLGREDALTFLSLERATLLAKFLEFVERNWLLGFGGMYLVDIPEIDFYDVPAHNFLLQALANYGILTLAAFIVYFICIFGYVQSTRARMLLIFLFIYSMNQPVQGTGNFFNPITLLYFLIAFAVDTIERSAAASAIAGHSGNSRRSSSESQPPISLSTS
jgi:O-Antigen ligase